MSPERIQVMMVVGLLLEDVAENPTRLKRAQEIAARDIEPELAKLEAQGAFAKAWKSAAKLYRKAARVRIASIVR